MAFNGAFPGFDPRTYSWIEPAFASKDFSTAGPGMNREFGRGRLGARCAVDGGIRSTSNSVGLNNGILMIAATLLARRCNPASFCNAMSFVSRSVP
eukprot:2613320-Pyramimonas_sp.AAC.1